MTESGLATFRIEKERWARFQQLAKDNNSNASKLIISFIEACLDSRIDINDYTIIHSKPEISNSDIDNNLDSRIDDYLDKYLDICIDNYLKKNLNNYIDIRIDNSAIRDRIGLSLEVALEPIKESVSQLETDSQAQFAAVRDELRAISDRKVEIPAATAKAPTIPRKEKPQADGETKTWCEFFKMVGIDALTATEAQKKENVDTRTKQIEEGLKAATDQGLGEWAVKISGRSFVRGRASKLDALPLFPN